MSLSVVLDDVLDLELLFFVDWVFFLEEPEDLELVLAFDLDDEDLDDLDVLVDDFFLSDPDFVFWPDDFAGTSWAQTSIV